MLLVDFAARSETRKKTACDVLGSTLTFSVVRSRQYASSSA
jgi:hypothetical protein